MSRWKPFPHDSEHFSYSGSELEAAWTELHAGDCAVFPDESWVSECLERWPEAAPPGFSGNLGELADTLQQCWRDFHAGAFGTAIEAAEQLGTLAHASANKAAGIYATYLESDKTQQQKCLVDASERADAARMVLPEDPNAHYLLAFTLGRYSQSISIGTALRQGIAGRISDALKRTLELAPEHAEAHTASGMYHAEIINKVGKMIGGITYGASAEKALEHFSRALELTPESPIAHIEYGNGLYLLYGDRRIAEVTDLFVKASELDPRDAMEKLDVEAALAELE